MNYLLLGGAPNVGKSETVWRAAHVLQNSRRFRVVAGDLPIEFADFRALLSGVGRNGDTINILFNSATDTVDLIQQFQNFRESLTTPPDIIVSSVRDGNFWPRAEFFTIMNINQSADFLLEIPLAKVTRRNDFEMALDWYRTTVDNLVMHVLSDQPYNV